MSVARQYLNWCGRLVSKYKYGKGRREYVASTEYLCAWYPWRSVTSPGMELGMIVSHQHVAAGSQAGVFWNSGVLSN